MAFNLGLIIILGLTADFLFRRLKVPGLVGMLLAGVLVGPFVLDLLSPQMMTVSGDLRRLALLVILLRAGLELRRDTLRRVGRAAVVMSCLPALFEIAGVMWAANRWLHLSYLDAAILGAILAAVSPAVVVPLMIDFIDRGRGTRKGIPTLVLGASSLDDVFVIVVFTLLLGLYGEAGGSVLAQLAAIPVSILLGTLAGLGVGYLLCRLFARADWQTPRRTLVVLGAATLLTWLETLAEPYVPVASLVGVMAIGFVLLERAEPLAHIIAGKLKKIWVFAELLLFVLVGAQVDVRVAWQAGLAGSLVIAVGLLARGVGTYLSLFGTDFDWREKLFCVVAYVPKATVQAAIGALPLAAGVASGETILAVAVLSILLTAPLGAVGIALLGDRILERDAPAGYRFKDLRAGLRLPHVGERVRSRRYGTVWKVIEQREEWVTPAAGSGGGRFAGNGPIPAIALRYWSGSGAGGPGRGRTMIYRYSREDPSFEEHWETLYEK